jgi:hypothetical protein
MSTTLQGIRKEIDTFRLMIRDWVDTLPIFKFEVAIIQERTARRLVLGYLEEKRNEIKAILDKERAEDDGRVIGRFLLDLFSATIRINLPKTKKPPALRVVISADGELSVTRNQIFEGIIMDETEFHACLDQIEKRVYEDSIDIEASPEIVAKGYLVEYYKTRLNNLPVFRKGSLMK